MTAYPVSRDKRYTIDKESGVHVVRFDGSKVGESRFYSAAVVLAVGDHARRNGALVIAEDRGESA